MASQIGHYKARLQQHRASIERLKSEIDELKRTNAYLAEENRRFRQQDTAPQKPHSNPILNSNGKRPLMDPYPHDRDYARPKTTSSPCSTTTPMGPDRLTLPPGQQAPNFTTNRQDQTVRDESRRQHHRALPGRSSHITEQYSYIPPSTPQFRPVPLTHAQATPRAYKLQSTAAMQSAQDNHGTFNPIGSSSSRPQRFKHAALGPQASSDFNTLANTSHDQGKVRSRQRNMGPPPTPQRFQQQNAALQTNAHQNARLPHEGGPAPTRRPISSIPTTNHFLPPAQRFAPPSLPPASSSQSLQPRDSQRMDGQLVGGNNSSMISAPGPRASSRATLPATGEGQRMPFVPASRNGFG
ncbi:hypothetical protein BD779DRAFT_1190129 [Infundibulicybe gibba]|nr:hypothetical protein BD779DRAFT_1190129 [Infundibulicybe gibba]